MSLLEDGLYTHVCWKAGHEALNLYITIIKKMFMPNLYITWIIIVQKSTPVVSEGYNDLIAYGSGV